MHSARLGPRDHQARTSRIQRDPVRLCSRLPGALLWGTQRAIGPTAGRVVAELHEAHTARANGAVIGPGAAVLDRLVELAHRASASPSPRPRPPPIAAPASGPSPPGRGGRS